MKNLSVSKKYKGLYFDDLKYGDNFVVPNDDNDIIYIKSEPKDGCNSLGISFKTGIISTFRYSWGTNPEVTKVDNVRIHCSEV